MRDYTFTLWHDGDRDTGIPGDQAEVKLSLPKDAEALSCAKDILRDAFASIWDTNRRHVMVDFYWEIDDE